jgi:tetratricopeptide (TPR) repeat protein
MMPQNSPRTFSRFEILAGFLCLLLFAAPSFCQDRSADQGGIRGNRAEVAITIKEGSSQLIGPLVTVKLYYLGSLTEQMTTSKGRVVFILNRLGDYTITADAVGYRSAQRELSIPVAVEAEEEIVLERNASPEALGMAARPLLAPKAKEAMDKALQALKDNRLDEAQRFLDLTAKLAPNHPDVLYLQGVVFLRRNQSEKAQAILEKATQMDPKNAQALSALGMALVNESRYDLAIAPLQKSEELDPNSWDTHYTLAKAFYHQQRFDDALKESQLALAQSHGAEPAIELLLAQTQTAVGKYEDSAETLRSFLRNHPQDKGAATAHRWLDRLASDGKIRKP